MKKTILRLKDRHYAQILDYLETDDHFVEIWKSGRKTKVDGQNQSKAIAFGHMATELQQLGWPVLSGAAIGKKNAQKQKAEFKTALLATKEKYRLGMLEERKAAQEEEMKARLAKEMLNRENAKKARLDQKIQ
ncbi:hypothetical protein R1flu_009660 [Riccia fluitans]|uniref:Uncharacterized protein n=1 Tax=Riccia fluitans TaxID=41844 RepID=A0ABD1Z2S4_9MARC